MAKDKFTNDIVDNKNDNDSRTISKEKKVILSFRENRPYEIFILNFKVRFEPAGKDGSSQEVPAWVIEHKDFQTEKHLFAIKEVE